MEREKLRSTISVRNKYTTYILPVILLVIDYLAVYAAEMLAFSLRNILVPSPVLRISWLSLHVFGPAIVLLFLQGYGLYGRRMQFWKAIARMFQASFFSVIAIIFVMYLTDISGHTSRLFIGLFAIFLFAFLVLFRYIAKRVMSRMKVMQVPVLVMGAGKTAAIVLKYLADDPGLSYEFIGVLEDNVPHPEVIKQMPCLGTFADAEEVIKETGVQRVLVVAPGLSSERTQELVYRLQPLVKTISFIPDLGSMPLATMDIESLLDGHIAIFKVRNNMIIWHNRFIKRVFDLVCTVLGIICLSPVFLAIALWIHKDSPGPIIFKHRRIGKDGKEFPCYKFRSMVVDADVKLKELLERDPEARKEWETEFKLKNDPRITKSGAFLRKTSLDELPQLFNVLKGEMSLVGPRPIIRAEIPKYGKYINDFYMVPPGITGMWQTSGRSDVSYDERVQMDTWYVRNWNVWFDIVLIWRTISVVLGKKGAY